MIELTDCQKKKLLKNLKNNKSIFIKLKPSQVKGRIANPFINLERTKNGFSLLIESSDFEDIKTGGILNKVFQINENTPIPSKDFHYSRCLKCENCDKCYGKGLMRVS